MNNLFKGLEKDDLQVHLLSIISLLTDTGPYNPTIVEKVRDGEITVSSRVTAR